MLMNVLNKLTTATEHLMQLVWMLSVVLNVFAMKDTTEMEQLALVSYYLS